MTSPLEAYPVIKEIEVAWGEMDAYGHVNNAVYFRYFETTRIRYLEQAGLIELMAATNVGPILSETKARFKAPVTFPDKLTVGARVSAITGDRFTMQYAILSEKSGRIVTEGEALPPITLDWVGRGELLCTSPEAMLRWLQDPHQEERNRPGPVPHHDQAALAPPGKPHRRPLRPGLRVPADGRLPACRGGRPQGGPPEGGPGPGPGPPGPGPPG